MKYQPDASSSRQTARPKSESGQKKDVQKLQRAIVDGLEDVKAQAIEVYNTEALSPLFERVIVASGTSNRQTKALAASVRDAVKAAGFPKPRIEGEDNGEWIIVDCGAAVAHIMQPAIRQYYNLEEIWGETPVRLRHGAAKPAVSKPAVSKPAGRKLAVSKPAPSKSAAGHGAANRSATVPSKPAATSRSQAPSSTPANPAAQPARARQAKPAARSAGAQTALKAAAKTAGSAASQSAVTPRKAAVKTAARTAVKTAVKKVVVKTTARKVAAKAAPLKSRSAASAPAKKTPAKKSAAQ